MAEAREEKKCPLFKKRERFCFEMDEMSGDHELYKEVFESTVAIMSTITALYLLFISNSIDPLAFAAQWLAGVFHFSSDIITAVLEGALELVSFFGVQTLVYTIQLRRAENRWAAANKELLLKGRWLHIHDKDNIRIGVVEIQQNFTQLKVKGFNVNPLNPQQDNPGRTKWSYVTCTLMPRDLTGIEFFGSYAARKADGTINQGIHIFHTLDTSSETGLPTYLNGNFCDSFRVGETTLSNIHDRKGEIHLFRMTPALEEIIFDNKGVNYKKLSEILSVKGLDDEPFIAMLNLIVANHKKREAKKETVKARKAQFQATVEQTLTPAQRGILRENSADLLPKPEHQTLWEILG